MNDKKKVCCANKLNIEFSSVISSPISRSYHGSSITTIFAKEIPTVYNQKLVFTGYYGVRSLDDQLLYPMHVH